MKEQQISPKEWQLLSEYLDGQLSQRDQERLEQHLRERDPLRQALDELRQTRAVLRSVRMQRVPRNFTLTPAMVAQSRPRPLLRLVPVLNFASALAAVAVVIVMLVQFLPGALPAAPQSAAQPSGAAPMAAPAYTTPATESGTQPVIIQWGGSGSGGNVANSTGPAMGMGGGGGGGGGSGGDQNPVLAQPPQAGNLPAPQQKSFDIPSTQPADSSAGSPEATAAPQMGAAMAPTETPPPAQGLLPAQPEAPAASSAPLEGSGPILGVQPQQQAEAQNQAELQQNQIELQSQSRSFKTNEQSPARANGWIVPALLALIAVGSAAAAFIIRRKASA